MPPPWYKWAVVGMLWFVCVLNYADRQAITAVYRSLHAEMGLSKEQFGIAVSAFAWVYALSMPFAGLVVDRVSRKMLILGGLTFWSIVTLLTGFATSFEELVLCRALEGFGEAFYFPASMSLVSDYHGKATRSRAMALHQSSVYAGTVLGGAFAGYCADVSGWRTGFYLFGGAGVLLAAVLLVTLKEPAREAASDDHRPPTPRELVRGAGIVFRTPMAVVLLVVFVGTVFVGSGFLAWTPTYIGQRFDQDQTWAALYATISLQTGSVIGVILGGYLADAWVRRSAAGRMWVMAVGLFAGTPLLFLAGRADALFVFLPLLALFGVCKGLYDSNTWASLYDTVRPEHRGTALGLVNGLGWLIGGASAPVLFAVAEKRYGGGPAISSTALVYLTAGVLLVAGTRLFFLRLPRKKGVP